MCFYSPVPTDVVVDIITGTSAGGINGAALALSQVNKQADLSRLRDLWAEQGRMEQLLRTPFRGQPASLLKGDEFFLPRLQEALARLTADFEPTEPDERPDDQEVPEASPHGAAHPSGQG